MPAWASSEQAASKAAADAAPSVQSATTPTNRRVSLEAALEGATPASSTSGDRKTDGGREWVPLSAFGGNLQGFMFSFTIRRADDVSLGLEVERELDDRALRVRKVLGGDAVGCWNKQCEESGASWEAVREGDMIVQANKALGCDNILQEIKSQLLIKLVIAREVAAPGGNGAPNADGSCGGMAMRVNLMDRLGLGGGIRAAPRSAA